MMPIVSYGTGFLAKETKGLDMPLALQEAFVINLRVFANKT